MEGGTERRQKGKKKEDENKRTCDEQKIQDERKKERKMEGKRKEWMNVLTKRKGRKEALSLS